MADPVVTVEIAFASNPLTAVPFWVDVSDYALGFDTRHGRQHELNRFEAGTCTLILDNKDRRFDPTNTSSPYYPNVLPVRKMRITATYGGNTYGIFQGFIEKWPLSWDEPFDGEIQVSAVDGFRFFAAVEPSITIGGDVGFFEVDAVLDAIGWPGADTTAGAVGETIIADTTYTNTSALSILQAIADAENGAFFIDSFGRAAFEGRYTRLGSGDPWNNSSQGTFGFGTGKIPYTTIEPAYDDTQIYNDVRVTAAGGVEQTATDATSQDTYFRRTLRKSGLIIGGPSPNNEALSYAQYLLNLYRNPVLRFRALTMSGHSDDSVWPHALGGDIGYRYTVEWTPPTGATVSQECFIEAVQHRMRHGSWETIWSLSLVSSQSFLVFDDPVLGRFDYNAFGY